MWLADTWGPWDTSLESSALNLANINDEHFSDILDLLPSTLFGALVSKTSPLGSISCDHFGLVWADIQGPDVFIKGTVSVLSEVPLFPLPPWWYPLDGGFR